MTAVSKSVYFDVLDDIFDEYNNAFHKTIDMKPIDVRFDSYTGYNVDSTQNDPKFKIDDHVKTSKYKTKLIKDIPIIGQKKVLLLAESKMQFNGLMLLVI